MSADDGAPELAPAAAGGDNARTSNLSRHNIPAICRIPGRGTGFLVSPGLILSSTRVVGTRQEASRLRAVFFEGGKRPLVEVALLPNQFYFAAAFPEYLDYCLVACETTKIFNVVPVKFPLVNSEWPAVREGDTILLVEHPVINAAVAPLPAVADNTQPQAVVSAANDPTTTTTIVKRFVEVLRRKEDRLFFRPQPGYLSAGCPCFNDAGALVGLLAQYYDGDALVCCAVSIVTIAKHLFANGRLSRIQQTPLFEDVWSTWYVTGDMSRIVSILTNFTHQRALHKDVALRLFEQTQSRDNVPSVIACGGTRVILGALREHAAGDPAFALQGIRALWNISFDLEDNRQQIRDSDGVSILLDIMAEYPDEASILQYSIVTLYNLTLTAATVDNECATRGLQLIFNAASRFPTAEVLQKFAIGFFQNVAVADVKYGLEMIEKGIISHVAQTMERFPANEYLNEHGVRLFSRVAQSPRYHGMPGLAVCVEPVIAAILRFDGSNALRLEGNHALWGLGVDPRNRIAIFQHPRGAEALHTSIGVVSATRPII